MDCFSQIIRSAKERGFSKELTKVAVMMELAGHDGELYGVQFMAENLHGQHETEQEKIKLFLNDIEVYESEYIMDHTQDDSRLNEKYGNEAEEKLEMYWNDTTDQIQSPETDVEIAHQY